MKTPSPLDLVALLARAVVGFIIGAFFGVIAGTFCGAVYFFGIWPQLQHVNWDNPGLSALPLIGAPFGAIIGAALGAVVAARRR